tara:strand:- start:316 stop:891 length:576 start_codon:yes stop_codon:yes gene_type:complete
VNKNVQNEKIELQSLAEEANHSFDGQCFCARCESISFMYTVRKVQLNALEERFAGTCLITEYNHREDDGTLVPKQSHDRDACRLTPQTLCSEKAWAQRAWNVYMAKADVEALAWRRLLDNRLREKNWTVLEGQIIINGGDPKSIDKLVNKEIKRLLGIVKNAEKDKYLKTYSTGDVDYKSPFAGLAVLKAS